MTECGWSMRSPKRRQHSQIRQVRSRLSTKLLPRATHRDPVGKWMQLGDQKYTVVGLVKDFHFESLHREVPPTIFIYSTDVYWEYVRINAKNIPATLQHVKTVYSKFVTNRDFQYTFLKDDVERQYVGEQKFTQVFTLFTILAIVVACLGTFGLISFTAERKS